MAREEKKTGKKRKDTQSDRDVSVQLAPTVEFLHEELSQALRQEVFENLRTSERERKWSLYVLAGFWLAVVLNAPKSLTELLERTRGEDRTGFLPEVSASSEANGYLLHAG